MKLFLFFFSLRSNNKDKKRVDIQAKDTRKREKRREETRRKIISFLEYATRR